MFVLICYAWRTNHTPSLAVLAMERVPEVGITILLEQWHASLTLAPFTSSTNLGKGLVKLVTCDDIPGRGMDIWRSGTFPGSTQVSMLPVTTTHHRATEQSIRGSLGNILSSESCPTGMEGMCHSSSQPPYIKVCLCTWQATASDKRWDEKTCLDTHGTKQHELISEVSPFILWQARSFCVCQCTQTCLNSAVYSK